MHFRGRDSGATFCLGLRFLGHLRRDILSAAGILRIQHATMQIPPLLESSDPTFGCMVQHWNGKLSSLCRCQNAQAHCIDLSMHSALHSEGVECRGLITLHLSRRIPQWLLPDTINTIRTVFQGLSVCHCTSETLLTLSGLPPFPSRWFGLCRCFGGRPCESTATARCLLLRSHGNRRHAQRGPENMRPGPKSTHHPHDPTHTGTDDFSQYCVFRPEVVRCITFTPFRHTWQHLSSKWCGVAVNGGETDWLKQPAGWTATPHPFVH